MLVSFCDSYLYLTRMLFLSRQVSWRRLTAVLLAALSLCVWQILKAFDIPDPCSALELNLEPFFSPGFQEA